MKEIQPLIFKYHNENNGWLYLAKYLNNHKIYFNQFDTFSLTIKENIDIANILRHENKYFIDLKKIKYSAYDNLFNFINYILINEGSITHQNYVSSKFKHNVIILMNFQYINYNYLDKLTWIIEKNQEYNNFIIFSTVLINKKFYKLKSMSHVINLNPVLEFSKLVNFNKTELRIFNLLQKDIYKTKLILPKLKGIRSNIKRYEAIKDEILIIKLLDTNLLTDNIYKITFHLIALYNNHIFIIKQILALVYFINETKLLAHKLFLKGGESVKTRKLLSLSQISFDDEVNNNIVSLQKFLKEFENIYNS